MTKSAGGINSVNVTRQPWIEIIWSTNLKVQSECSLISVTYWLSLEHIRLLKETLDYLADQPKELWGVMSVVKPLLHGADLGCDSADLADQGDQEWQARYGRPSPLPLLLLKRRNPRSSNFSTPLSFCDPMLLFTTCSQWLICWQTFPRATTLRHYRACIRLKVFLKTRRLDEWLHCVYRLLLLGSLYKLKQQERDLWRVHKLTLLIPSTTTSWGT